MTDEPSTPPGIIELVMRSNVAFTLLFGIFTFVLILRKSDVAMIALMVNLCTASLNLLGGALINTRSRNPNLVTVMKDSSTSETTIKLPQTSTP